MYSQHSFVSQKTESNFYLITTQGNMDITPEFLQTLSRHVSSSWSEVAPLAASSLAVITKEDNSPVTQVDIRLSELLIERLSNWSGYPVLTEEHCLPFEEKKELPFYWLIDPIDGTKDFIAGTGDFSINVALMGNHSPVAAVMMIPERQVVYSGAPSLGLWKNGEKVERRQESLVPPISAALSRFHEEKETEEWLLNSGVQKVVRAGSAYKMALVADGSIDFYPRLGNTHDWDIAAGHCLLKSAGAVLQLVATGEEPTYSDPSFSIGPFMAGTLDCVQWMRKQYLSR